MKTAKLRNAQKHCCNWDSGNCIGVMLSSKDGELKVFLDSDKENKPCTADTECKYYDNIVKKIINIL